MQIRVQIEALQRKQFTHVEHTHTHTQNTKWQKQHQHRNRFPRKKQKELIKMNFWCRTYLSIVVITIIIHL